MENAYEFKKVLREVQILRMLSEMENNVFTTKLIDIIIPSEKDSDTIFLVMDYMPFSLRNLLNKSVKGEILLTE
jgi:serine/threonine protein kinase